VAKQISFARSLYLQEAVEAAATAYSEHAKIEILPQGDAVVAVIGEVTGADADLVTNAFCNHVLYETIARKREAESQGSE